MYTYSSSGITTSEYFRPAAQTMFDEVAKITIGASHVKYYHTQLSPWIIAQDGSPYRYQ